MKHISHIKPFLTDTAIVCVTCPVSKLTKFPFQKSASYAAWPFDLLHIDTWGPYKVLTRRKFKYFLTVVDDHSRMIWLFLLTAKSDFFNTIQTFANFVLNQYGANIKVIRTDNAPEFSDEKMHSVLQ